MADHTIVFHLIKVSQRIQKAMGLKTRNLELSSSEARALIIIESYKDINQVSIANKLHLNPASIVSLIDELEGMKLVTRHMGKNDRRKYHIHLTSKGEGEVKHIRQRTKMIDDYIKSKLTKNEVKNFISSLEKLSEDDVLKIEQLNTQSKEVKNEIPGTKRQMEA